MTEPRRTLTLYPDEAVAREPGLWMATLDDTRGRTFEVLRGISDEHIDRVPPDGGSTIGAILYHIAVVEGDWLYDEILGSIEKNWPVALFPVAMREDGNTLSAFTGESLDEHLGRLETVRGMLIAAVTSMTGEQMHELRRRRHYDVSVAWVLHHLMQHEAEHRSQIVRIRESLGIAPS